MEYPLLHVYPQPGPRQAVRIVANTEGLITLSIALLEAVSITEKGSSEVFCADAEAYEVQVVRDDSNNTWGKLKLPYVFSSSSQNNVNEDNFRRTIGYASFDEKGNWRVEVTEPQFLEWRKSRESDHRYITFLPDRDIYKVKHRMFRIMRDRYGIEPAP